MITAEQRQVAATYQRLKVGKATAADHAALVAVKKQARNGDTAERMRRSTALKMDIQSKPEWRQITKRRAACANNLLLFIQTYLGHRFPLPFSTDHLELLERVQAVALGKAGERQAVASPRGDGKTERTLAAILWAILYGHHRYVIAVCANLDKSKKLVTELIQELADNDELLADWPSICTPIRSAFSKPNRAKYLTIDGDPIRLECRTCKLVLPTWSGDPANLGGAVIEAVGILQTRGLRHTTANGTVLRPSLALLDDPATSESAASPQQVAKLETAIASDVMRAAGPRKAVSAFLNCTVIRRNDAADRLLDNKRHPEWRGKRTQMIKTWPKNRALWDKYMELRKTGLVEGDKGAAATAFYVANRKDMDAGAVVSWIHRFNADAGELSAIQNAMNVLCDDGEAAFASECQNEPLAMQNTVYEIKPELVAGRVNKLPAGEAPANARVLTAFIDVNRYGLTWTVCAWQNDLTGYVIAYGIYPPDRPVFDPKNPGSETEPQAVFRCLSELGKTLTRPGAFMRSGLPARLDAVLVDAGYLSETVLQFVRTVPLPGTWVPSRGRAARSFNVRQNATTVRRGDNWRVDSWTGGNVLIHSSDHHRMNMHGAWLLPHGAPGGLTIFGDTPAQHVSYARQVTAERLAEYVRGDVCDHYVWHGVPGEKNDYLDATVGCRVAASYLLNIAGAPLAGQPTPAPQPPPPLATIQPARPQTPAAPRRDRHSISYVKGWEPQSW